MRSDFIFFSHQFFGVSSLADYFNVSGAPARVSNEAAFDFVAGDGIDFGGELQLNPKELKKFKAELLVTNTAGGAVLPNSVPATGIVQFGLIAGAVVADPTAVPGLKYIMFEVNGTIGAAETDEIRVKASDGTNTYDEQYRITDERSREWEIDLNAGVEDVKMTVGGKPAHNVHTRLNLPQITDADRMQPFLQVQGADTKLRLAQIEAWGNRSLLK